MANPFRDNTYIWVVWHRGKQPSEVTGVVGLYRSREEALHQASQANAEGMTPIKDRIVANILKISLPDLIEKNITN